jgi:hypothetical protein
MTTQAATMAEGELPHDVALYGFDGSVSSGSPAFGITSAVPADSVPDVGGGVTANVDETTWVALEKDGNCPSDHCNFTLRNTILCLCDTLWYLEFNAAVHDGDTGHVFEIIKVCCFTSRTSYHLSCIFRSSASISGVWVQQIMATRSWNSHATGSMNSPKGLELQSSITTL